MIRTTTADVPGREVVEVLGFVKGNTIRARHVGRDILAKMRGVVGGEIPEYTKLMAESRDQALDRMTREAQELGADAVVGIRITTSLVMTTASEILAYGTAVKLK